MLSAQASTIVYQDTFDDTTRVTNSTGIGGGMAREHAQDADFNESSGRIAYAGGGSGNRATVYTTNYFNLVNGFILDVDYTLDNFNFGENEQFAFGLKVDLSTNANNTSPCVSTSPDLDGVGFNLTAQGGFPQGLILTETGATVTNISPFTFPTNLTQLGSQHNLTLTVTPRVDGGADWRYVYDGTNAPVIGSIPAFNFATNFNFYTHGRVGTTKILHEVTLTALFEQATVIAVQ